MSDVYSAVEHAQSEYKRQTYTRLERRIDDGLEKCAKLLINDGVEADATVAATLAQDVIPDIETLANSQVDLYSYLSSVDVRSLLRVKYHRDELLQQLQSGGVNRSRARETIKRALRSAEAIAEEESVVLDEYSGRVDAVGFETQLGVHLQDREMDIGDPVRLVTEQSGALKTLYSGGTGNGKSVCLEREAEDYYRRNEADTGREFKIIDPAGLRDGENWLYDIPNHDDDLIERRDEQDLPPTFVESEYRQPEIEILVPLTPGLKDRNLPFDVDAGEFTVRPFTIPAADIRKSLLVSILTAKLTPEQESVIRDAYDTVDNRRNDWALRDLAEEIRSRDELKASKRKPPIRTLRQLQNRGFIRTGDSEHAIDWREMFEDTDTYTVFSQSFLDTAIAQLIVFGYLADSIVKKRERMYDIPEAVVVMRELWKIAPHNQRQEFDERAAQLQEAIGHMFSRLFRDNRHSSVHVLADTQQPSDLLKPVREMFNRYVVFSTNKKTVKDIFDWTSSDNWRAFYGTLTPKAGEASIAGMVEPAVEERNIEFVGPVRYATPSHHHKMERFDSTGWHARSKYFTPTAECPECGHDELDRSDDGWTVTCPECDTETTDYSRGRNEELRTPAEVGVDWAFDVPTKLMMEREDAGSDRPDPATSPVAAFADRCLFHAADARVRRSTVRAAFNEFVVEHEDIDRDEGWDFEASGVLERFGRRLHDAVEDDIGRTTIGGERAYSNLGLTDTGQRFVPDDVGDAR